MAEQNPTESDLPYARADLSRRTFHTLDALRGIAAAIVLTRHAPTFFGSALVPGSALAVDLFFLMSGFVIAHAYEDRMRDGMSLADFLRRRLIRLYPLYILGTSIGVAVAALSILTGVKSTLIGFTWTWSRLVVSALPAGLVLPSPPIPGSALSLFPLNAVAWSLAFEILINIVYAATLFAWSDRRLIWLIAVSSLAVVASVTYYGSTDIGWNWLNWPGGFARIFFSFPLGVLLHRLHKRGTLRWQTSVWVPLAAAVLVLCLPLPSSLLLPFHAAVILAAFPLIVALAVCTEPPAWLERPFLFLGVTSYAAYALQRPVLSVINGVAKALHLSPETAAPWTGLPFLAAYFAFCWLVDLAYDKPVRGFLTDGLRLRAKSNSLEVKATS